MSPAFVRDGTLLAAWEMLRGGVTCFSDMYFYPEAAAEAAREAGIRAMLGLAVLEFPTAYAHDAEMNGLRLDRHAAKSLRLRRGRDDDGGGEIGGGHVLAMIIQLNQTLHAGARDLPRRFGSRETAADDVHGFHGRLLTRRERGSSGTS